MNLAIHEATAQEKGLADALRAVVAKGGTIATRWPATRPVVSAKIRAPTSPRRFASNSGRLPNQRESGARWSTLTALPVRRSRQPLTS